MGRGYSSSPLLFKGTIIVTMGGPDQGVAAFNQQTGALVWKSGDIVVGMDPSNGRGLWSHPQGRSGA